MKNAQDRSYSPSREEGSGDFGELSGLDENMISAVSDFSGLDAIMDAHSEESPVVTRFSHVPSFPELLPEVQAELLEIQAAMDSARAEREAVKNPDVLSSAVSDEVDRIVRAPFGEFVNTHVPPPSVIRQSSHEIRASDVPSELPSDEIEIPKIPAIVDVVR